MKSFELYHSLLSQNYKWTHNQLYHSHAGLYSINVTQHSQQKENKMKIHLTLKLLIGKIEIEFHKKITFIKECVYLYQILSHFIGLDMKLSNDFISRTPFIMK